MKNRTTIATKQEEPGSTDTPNTNTSRGAACAQCRGTQARDEMYACLNDACSGTSRAVAGYQGAPILYCIACMYRSHRSCDSAEFGSKATAEETMREISDLEAHLDAISAQLEEYEGNSVEYMLSEVGGWGK